MDAEVVEACSIIDGQKIASYSGTTHADASPKPLFILIFHFTYEIYFLSNYGLHKQDAKTCNNFFYA
jgi:hypothetical protein